LAFVSKQTSFGNQLSPERAAITLLGPDSLMRFGFGDHPGDESLDGFPAAFRQGMATKARIRVLDDIGRSAPEHWLWGSEQKPVDMVVICYAATGEILDADIHEMLRVAGRAGVKLVAQLPLTIN